MRGLNGNEELALYHWVCSLPYNTPNARWVRRVLRWSNRWVLGFPYHPITSNDEGYDLLGRFGTHYHFNFDKEQIKQNRKNYPKLYETW